MKIFLEIHIKPFSAKSYKPYSGFYTPKGRRNQKCKIEIDSGLSYIEQIGAFLHEIGHLISEIWGGSVLSKNQKGEEKEHQFCEPLEKAGIRLWKKFLGIQNK